MVCYKGLYVKLLYLLVSSSSVAEIIIIWEKGSKLLRISNHFIKLVKQLMFKHLSTTEQSS